mmetsp:Transcript_39509/g.86295  ORF Transcript_39509/g.86295 Transcript_39509/m.86295 type:complete len:262 (-) Transcript_39509:2664-3449(-)
MASRNDLAPTGMTMNSWQASRLPAWEPPLITLKEGTGSTKWSSGFPAREAMCWKRRFPIAAAPARQTAMETARIALAPRAVLLQPHSFCVPSHLSTIILSMVTCCVASMPMICGPMTSRTFRTARRTPLPMAREASPSRNSRASYTPVDAPDGTAARKEPRDVQTSTSTVGTPRESKISRAVTWTMRPGLDAPSCGLPALPGLTILGWPVESTSRAIQRPFMFTLFLGRVETSLMGMKTFLLSTSPTAKSVYPAITPCTIW